MEITAQRPMQHVNNPLQRSHHKYLATRGFVPYDRLERRDKLDEW